jgi:hypothetical protein
MVGYPSSSDRFFQALLWTVETRELAKPCEAASIDDVGKAIGSLRGFPAWTGFQPC